MNLNQRACADTPIDLGASSPWLREKLHTFLGLPFDLVTVDETCRKVTDAVANQQRLFLTTPNVNFVVTCLRSAAFRNSVIDSDWVVVDGMPLVWLGRWLGLPVPERVAGSSVFETLQCTPPSVGQQKLRVYFFGGPPGAAGDAADKMNADTVGMVCVGYASPGFGTVESMSTPELIDVINAAQADFLVVALGAEKGQAWIQRNRERLNVPVISHLGAVVNFAAGGLRRAPFGWQRAGLEWLWRIKEEPNLWRRYAKDGLGLCRLIMTQAVPCKWHIVVGQFNKRSQDKAGILVTREKQRVSIHLHGAWLCQKSAFLKARLALVVDETLPIHLDFSKLQDIDAKVLGDIFMLLQQRRSQGKELWIDPVPLKVRRLFSYYGVDYLLEDKAPAVAVGQDGNRIF
ncbi:WecB/TagA/CpsF family glycosyltransferase [Polaromonas sp.]|uniref:WecB/TagA/CpsF family glycosyltransferase n=1 Tax=Polaromonas sp. TaxID=1869339 RepID=UPI0017BEEC7A|nr:WecB/TagA/CpsF family glycosyltransferase [Polaromonas sp.]NMM06425.1 WecB/TagA/CpsF family glycosyltransferase [Polaromonas sp.]